MNNDLSFGTFNVPSLSESLTASFTAPSILPKEMLSRLSFNNEREFKGYSNEVKNSFDTTLTGLLKVPKLR